MPSPSPRRRVPRWLVTTALVLAGVAVCVVCGCLCFLALLLVVAVTEAKSIIDPGALAIALASACAVPILVRDMLAERPDGPPDQPA